jgi:nucleotide-binding universal stress UspA family protein
VYKHKRVLVALDGSPSAEAVMRFLLEIAEALDMTVLLLRVLEPIPAMAIEGTTNFTSGDNVEMRHYDAEEYLAPLAARLRGQGVAATCQVRRGRPAEQILAVARESHADLIAMATHGRTGFGRLLFGSVAEEVLRRASVPVFMIRQPDAVDEATATKEGFAR